MASPSAYVLAGRILLLAVAMGAVVAAATAGRRARVAQAEGDVSYSCPMHPQVRSASAGECPICHMVLEADRPPAETGVKTATEASPAAAPDSFTLPNGAEIHAFDEVAHAKTYDISREMRAPACLEGDGRGVALLYRDEQELLGPEEEATFYPAIRPRDGVAAGVKARLAGEPPIRWDAATVLVRFRTDRTPDASPRRCGSLKLATRLRTGLVVTASAIVRSPDGPSVFVLANDGRTLTRRHIDIGSVLYGYAGVISGLDKGERVVSRGAFFLEAERRRRGGTER
jgi:hypothetical protein